jgi:hypothetical protein
MESRKGVKSKQFGCYWKTMFLTSLCYPNKINLKDPEQVKLQKNYKVYYGSFENILPCKFCRMFIKETLNKDYPLNFTGRNALFKSIYIWKDQVNKKLIKQGYTDVIVSPKLSVVKKRYKDYVAKSCNKNIGKCV